MRIAALPFIGVEIRKDCTEFLKPDASDDLKKVKRAAEALRKHGISYGSLETARGQALISPADDAD